MGTFKDSMEFVARFRLLDDEFMSVVFDGSIEATELLLRIVLEREDIFVRSVVAQREFKNLMGKSVRFDIYAEDSSGKPYDIEIQRKDVGAGAERARYNSSLMDMRLLSKGQKHAELKDSYVIFITESDFYGKGLPLYHVERVIKEIDVDFMDGSHIIYVNGQYKNDATPIGRLMHDFRCDKPSDMYYKVLADRAYHFKETEGGRTVLCKMVEDYVRIHEIRMFAETCVDFGVTTLDGIVAKATQKFKEFSEEQLREIIAPVLG